MEVYDRAAKAVPDHEKMEIYDLYIACIAENFGVPETRDIYLKAIESEIPDKYVKKLCMNFAELERILVEIDRARKIYVYSAQMADPCSDQEVWNKWHEFEVQHGNEDTFREMLRIKRSVSASFSQTHFKLSEYLMQKDPGKLTFEEPVDTLKRADVPEDEMAVLERQLAPAAVPSTAQKLGMRSLGFVSAGVDSQAGVTCTSDGVRKITANPEDIELQEESEEDNKSDERVEVAQKDVPSAVFGELANKTQTQDNEGDSDRKKRGREEPMGALERIKRQRRQ